MRADATKASGTYAHAEGTGTSATGNTGSHAEGQNGTASGPASHTEGYGGTASGSYCHAEGDTTISSGQGTHSEGVSTNASGLGAHAEGYQSQAPGDYSHAQGRQAKAIAAGQHAQAAGQFTAAGDAQTATYVARQSTTDATPAVLFFNGGASATLTGAAVNVLTVPVDRAHQFTVNVVARRSDVSGDTAGWEFRGLVGRGSSGNAALVGTTLGSSWGAAGAAAWDVTLAIDTTNATNNYLAITVTGEAAKTIRWVARIVTVEVG